MAAVRPNTRASRLKQALKTAGGPISVAALLTHMHAGDNTNNFIRGLMKLEDAGKARRVDGAGIQSRWEATADLLIDRRRNNFRTAAAQAYQERRKAKAIAIAELKKAAPKAALGRPKATAETPRNTPPAPTAEMKASLTKLFAYNGSFKKPRDITSEQVEDDIARFLASGGRIQKLKSGESSQSQAFEAELARKGLKAINEANWRRKQNALIEQDEPETEEA